jgi:hypothetical protein
LPWVDPADIPHQPHAALVCVHRGLSWYE